MPARIKSGAAALREAWDVWLLRPLADYITLGEAAEDLDLSRQAVHRLVERGTLKARRVGRRPIVLVRARDVRELPMTPQRRRELEFKHAEISADGAELGDGLPEG